MTLTSLPGQPITLPCRQRPYSRPAPSAQPVEAPAPRPRSGIAGLPAHGLWPELTVATGSSSSSLCGHRPGRPGYLCPCRHSQAVKPLWFGLTLTQYLVTRSVGRNCWRVAGILSLASQLVSYALVLQSWCACTPFPSYAQASLRRINKWLKMPQDVTSSNSLPQAPTPSRSSGGRDYGYRQLQDFCWG